MKIFPREKLTEKQKMLDGKYYKHNDGVLSEERCRASSLTYDFNLTNTIDVVKRQYLLRLLLGHLGGDCEIKPPFQCDYGYNIIIGNRVFINYNCTMLDCSQIEIGDDTLIAPGVRILTATHPTDPRLRLEKLEFALPVKIGKNVWIGSGAIICPGVEIGDNTTIGAGSIVTKSIPSDVVAVGNPCIIIRQLS